MEEVDTGGAAKSFGMWDPSIHDGPHCFSEGGLCLNGGKETAGGTALLGG